MELNSRVTYHTICATYVDYILLLLASDNFLLTSKKGECCILLEYSPSIIPLIDPSHKWTQILFIVLNLQTWNLALQPYQNIYKTKIQLL